ncbi:MAG: betC 3 [Verrucomicrobiales bacterium]|nr:betC 3 [Verrucomicrobiales bacterium]
MKFQSLLRIVFVLVTGAMTAFAAPSKDKPNVLLIIADDLNNWIGPMKGHPQTITSNLDRLAKRGVTFMNAQASAPLCNPSRASFMTGRRPSTTGIYNNDQPAMPHIPRGVAINDYLRKFGYTSLGSGKIYHYHQYREEDWDKVVFYADDTLPNHEAVRRPGPFGYRMFTEGKPEEKFNEERAESALVDYRSVSWAIDQLQQQNGNFFLACGIHRPHTPWDIPKKYYDMHPMESITLPEVLPNDLDDIPQAGINFAKPNGVHQQIVKMGIWKDRVRAYLAAISYCDAQVGRLLDALDKSKFADNTIVIFVGDNGWHLGEKKHWGKSALWRQADNVPLIWSVPGLAKDSSCDRAVDLTCMFPTICELTGTPIPAWCEGPSIAKLLKKPSAKWDKPAIATFEQNNHAIITDEWRYIHYADGSEELYNEKSDGREWTNQAKDPKLTKVKTELAKYLPKVNATPVPDRPADSRPNKKKRKARSPE